MRRPRLGPFDVRRWKWLPWLLLLSGALVCDQEPAPGDGGLSLETLDVAVGPLPGTRPAHRERAYWEGLWDQRYDLDETLLSRGAIQRANVHLVRSTARLAPDDLRRVPDASALRRQIDERLAYLRRRVISGKLRDATGAPLSADLGKRFTLRRTLPTLSPRLRRADAVIPVRCGPLLRGLFKPGGDLRFDRNNCSSIHPGEPVQVLARWSRELLLVRTTYTLGWIPVSAPLTSIRADASLGDGPDGFPAFTRRAFLRAAFALLDAPYGWGGEDGGLDCSRFVMQVLAGFGLRLPRASGPQSRAGVFTIDLQPVPDGHRLAVLDRAAKSGVVLLHLPGHIMFYLGRDDRGEPMVLHSLAEYAEPVEDQPDRVVPVERVCVSHLDLGEGSRRGSLLERLDRLTVLGGPADPALQGVATLRPAVPIEHPETCAASDSAPGSEGSWLFTTPARPHPGQPLRVIATRWDHPGPVTLQLFDPAGRPRKAKLRRYGGPPFGWVAEVDAPAPGTWTAVLGDGPHPVVCRTVEVRPQASPPAPPDGPLTWPVTRRWDARTEALYAVFVEALFRYPWRNAPTWRGLTPLVRNRARNLLYGHFADHEERELRLTPDCADLPYMLRAYFAWKLGLPHAFRACSRADGERPVRCDDLRGHIAYSLDDTPAKTFHHYAHQLKGRVHSSSARTRPGDDDTDYHPVPLRRETLPPGTVFADPYGHTLMLVRWIPQTARHPGVLVAADAQPDGSVGLRRFWQGTFVFQPDTDLVGAGFKAARPVRYDADEGRFHTPPNRALTSYVLPYHRDQYRGDARRFYHRLSRLINPLPLDPERRLVSRVAALHESVQRRVTSVALGERFMAERRETVDMPHGADIFLTRGPWEDYATPSRDLRLLLAMDVVTRLITEVKRHPARFGVPPKQRAEVLQRLTERLTRELRRRTVRYVRSDGSPWILTLGEVMSRQRALEMGYNPNDCVEVRWGAPAGSTERETCERRAPASQRARMQSLRPWFARRTRPVR